APMPPNQAGARSNEQRALHGRLVGEGECAPASDAGRRLIAYELARVVKQEGRMHAAGERFSLGAVRIPRTRPRCTIDAIVEQIRRRRSIGSTKRQSTAGTMTGESGVVTV